MKAKQELSEKAKQLFKLAQAMDARVESAEKLALELTYFRSTRIKFESLLDTRKRASKRLWLAYIKESK